jgi:prepilin-type N-terminal cleavage/methylation domain-containing protein
MQRRRGFTIPELLVAMALILFIMAILSEAFVAGLDSFRQLKAVGDMQEKLRATTVQLRYDLYAQHFGDPTGTVITAGPSSKLSNLAGPPPAGFFRISQGSLVGSPAYVLEGSDPGPAPILGANSYRASDHILHFTVAKVPGPPQNYYSATVPAGMPATYPLDQRIGPADYQQSGIVNTSWAEVAYFLRATVDSAGNQVFAGNTPMYTLYRRQCLILNLVDATNPAGINFAPNQVAAGSWSSYPEMSCQSVGGFLHFNSPVDVTTPTNRCLWNNPAAPTTTPPPGVTPMPPTNPYYQIMGDRAETTRIGDDLLLTDVISFQVQILRPGDFQFVDVQPPAPQPVYDTAINWYQIRALQITIRVWDVKTQQTRQITVVSDM